MQKNAVRTIPTDHVPEVQRFVDAESRLQQFIEQNVELMDALADLVEQRNDALQDADSAVRAMCAREGRGIDCGPFKFKHFSERVDAERAFDALARDRFTLLGGAVKQVPSYVIEKALVVRAIESGEVTREEAEEFYSKVPNYHKIPLVVLP